MKNLLFVAAALLGACATQPPKPAATPVEMTECIALAAPAAKAGATINEALAARRSWREFGSEKLSLEELSGVLWAAAGENRTDGKLTAPSALALYPITVYAVFEEGIYRYDGREQTLTRVAEGDHRAAAGRQPFVATAPLNLVYIADLQTYEGKGIPEENVLMLCAMDAAGYAENVNLYTAGHALRSITRGSAAADELLSLLRLDPARYRFILAPSSFRNAPFLETIGSAYRNNQRIAPILVRLDHVLQACGDIPPVGYRIVEPCTEVDAGRPVAEIIDADTRQRIEIPTVGYGEQVVYVAIQIDRTAVVAEQRQRRFQTQLVENIVTRSGSDAENRIRIPRRVNVNTRHDRPIALVLSRSRRRDADDSRKQQ